MRLSDLVVDPVSQLTALADLLDRGLVSREEFDGLVAQLALGVNRGGPR